METFSALLALFEGNPLVTGRFPHKASNAKALMFTLICAWTKSWANNWDAGDMKRHGAHYDVIVMISLKTVPPTRRIHLSQGFRSVFYAGGAAKFRPLCWMTSLDPLSWWWINGRQIHVKENISNFSVITVLADGLARWKPNPGPVCILERYSKVYTSTYLTPSVLHVIYVIRVLPPDKPKVLRSIVTTALDFSPVTAIKLWAGIRLEVPVVSLTR